MNTPILRAKKGSQLQLFYNDGEYETWKETLGTTGINGWTIKYFKGLGTSTSAEFKDYFANKKIVDFIHSGVISDDSIDKVFNKKRPDDRKVWLEQYDKKQFLNTGRSQVAYEEFIDQEMIHFSTYDCARSIPNMVDGLKTSLRKILYSAFKRKLTSEIKVAQFSGYVSEHSAYHHGEASLNGAIVNMAQNFVGSNNINLLEPLGQFGTRLQGGDDSASERYIFTHLNTLTRSIFPDVDDSILTYLDDDGTIVEPEYYIPIIPFCLMNGISGIGTGFSCSIPSYSPKQIIDYLMAKLLGKSLETFEFVPYYEGFKGTVKKIDSAKYLIKGTYEKLSDDKIRITELPIGTWTMPYITFLEELLDGSVDKQGKKSAPVIKDIDNLSTEVDVNITVTFPKGRLSELEGISNGDINGIEKMLKLSTSVSTTNMHMFDADRKLHKYESVEEIIEAFFSIRLKAYETRKAAQLVEMNKVLKRLSNKSRYIQDTLVGTIDLRKKKSDEVIQLLEELKYDRMEGEYKYLVKMPMDSVTEENVAHIMKDTENTSLAISELEKTSIESIWINELNILEKEYNSYKIKREKIQSGSAIKNSGSKKVLKKK
jgi:DNA topoisomerase-2